MNPRQVCSTIRITPTCIPGGYTVSPSETVIYLDNSGTTLPLPDVVQKVSEVMQHVYGNPSALHRMGLDAEAILDDSRSTFADLLGVTPNEVYFTSGATESNNTLIRGVARAYAHRGNHIVTSTAEHPSVMRVCEELQTEGWDVAYVPVDERGIVDPDDVAAALRDDTVLCSIMAVNNEIGSVQPLEEVGLILSRMPSPRPILHTDAVQAVGKISWDPVSLGIDALSISAHKFHGPRGVGVLYVRRGLGIPPLLVGGGQERGLRSGTENTPAIAGAAVAARWLVREGAGAYESLRPLRGRLGRRLLKDVPPAYINGPGPDAPADETAPHILSISFPGVKGEVLVHALAEQGIFVSTGAACSSRRHEPGTVAALPVAKDRAESAVRISLSPFNTLDEINHTVEVITRIVPRLRRIGHRTQGAR